MSKSAIKNYLASIGRKGGESTSPAKIAASRANGAKRKKAVKPAPK